MNKNLIYSLTEAIVPTAPFLSKMERISITREVSEYIALRINSSIFLMRIPLKILILFLAFSHLLVTLRTFSQSSISQRRKHTERIAKWHALHMNDLMKLMKALMLIAYYDNPIVRKSIGYVDDFSKLD